jgi:hypothetical protein
MVSEVQDAAIGHYCRVIDAIGDSAEMLIQKLGDDVDGYERVMQIERDGKPVEDRMPVSLNCLCLAFDLWYKLQNQQAGAEHGDVLVKLAEAIKSRKKPEPAEAERVVTEPDALHAEPEEALRQCLLYIPSLDVTGTVHVDNALKQHRQTLRFNETAAQRGVMMFLVTFIGRATIDQLEQIVAATTVRTAQLKTESETKQETYKFVVTGEIPSEAVIESKTFPSSDRQFGTYYESISTAGVEQGVWDGLCRTYPGLVLKIWRNGELLRTRVPEDYKPPEPEPTPIRDLEQRLHRIIDEYEHEGEEPPDAIDYLGEICGRLNVHCFHYGGDTVSMAGSDHATIVRHVKDAQKYLADIESSDLIKPEIECLSTELHQLRLHLDAMDELLRITPEPKPE